MLFSLSPTLSTFDPAPSLILQICTKCSPRVVQPQGLTGNDSKDFDNLMMSKDKYGPSWLCSKEVLRIWNLNKTKIMLINRT